MPASILRPVLLAQLAFVVAVAEIASPLAKVISLLGELEVKVKEESKAEAAKLKEYTDLCESRTSELQYEIKTAKTKIEELTAKISKASGKLEAAASSFEETQGSVASNQADLAAATEVRRRESDDFKAAEKDLMDTASTIQKAISVVEVQESKGDASLLHIKGAGSAVEAVQAMIDASLLQHEDAKTLTALLQGRDLQPVAPAYEKKNGGVAALLEDLYDKSKDELAELRKKETAAKHSFEMVVQSLQDELKFGKEEAEKSKQFQAEQARLKADGEKDLERRQASLASDEKTLADFTKSCKEETRDAQEAAASRDAELEALGQAKAAIADSMPGTSFLQLASVSHIRTSDDLKHYEVVRIVRALGQKTDDHQLILLSRKIDSMLQDEASAGADVFAKIRKILEDMIASMQKNLQEEASKKEYCDAEMAKSNKAKGEKEGQQDSLATKMDGVASKSAMLKHEVEDLRKELTALAATKAKMTQLRQDEKALFEKSEPETVAAMDGVKTAVRTLKSFYEHEQGGTSGARNGAAGVIVDRLEEVEADCAKGLAQMRSAEKTAEKDFEKDMQDMDVEKTEKEKDIEYKEADAKRLDAELSSLQADQDSLGTEMQALLEFHSGLEAQCLVTPETFREKQAKKQEEIEGLEEALKVIEGTGSSLLQRGARSLRGQQKLGTD
eukprot:TRINITY_DN13677_c0_g2_i1.p1 TRINITY_DN13677_c0_g2~~TRINITY_DN13677_c0_g2_i1.p1  ORF type:complete len:675 (-),score=264.47 TRINITY_DN13677_c0_g2_i1:88-2112(-)